MKRYLLSFFLGIFAFSNISLAQIELSFSSQNGNANGTVDIDVTIDGFTDISGLQYSVGWDSLVMTFNSVVSTNSSLPDLQASNISGPEGAAVDEGQFSFSYNNPVGDGNLDDGSVLFTVRFNLVGEECSTTNLELTEDPTSIEAFNVDFTLLDVTAQNGTVMINGTDCGGGGGGDDDLTITAETLTVNAGGNICVPLTVTNFENVQAGSGTILWDPEVISYTGLDNANLTGVTGSLNTSNTDGGELKFVWSNPDPVNPLAIPDGQQIFDICFNAVGAVGEMSTITLSTQGSLGFEWFDDNDDEITQSLNNGKVTITGDTGNAFTLTVGEVTINADGIGCAPISVMNFDNILSTQYVISWNTGIINNATTTSYNLDGLNASSFNIDNSGGSAVVSWSGPSGINVPDGTVIYEICFDAVGACDDSSPVDIISQGSTNIEIIDGNTSEVTNVNINQGSVTIVCPGECSIVNIDRPCAGALNGNVTVLVEDGCDYSWANSAGTEISVSKNLLGVAAGTYILTVTCDGVETCVLEAEVIALPEMTINETIVNAGCGELGSINVNVSGGSGNYSYNWSPAQPNSATISNLDPGTYNLTVTDTENTCTKTATYQVITTEGDLVISSVDVNDETCNENDGSITLSLMGGCMPYTYNWSDGSIGNTPNAVNLTEGNYTVTITDNQSNMVTGSYTVDGPSMITQVGSENIISSTGNDGSISFQVEGGTSPYSYSWTGPTSGLPNSNSVTGLAPGDYTVVVSDASGCSETFMFTVPNDAGGTDPVVQNVVAVQSGSLFNLRCVGDMDGSISGNISEGSGPFTITLSGDDAQVINQADKGTFTIDGLSAGTYTVTVSNGSGNDAVETGIEITEPDDALQFDIDTGCDEGDQCDGFIDLNVSGGEGAYTYEWTDLSFDGDSVDDLCKGSYTVFVTDENGCQIMETIDIEDCAGPVEPGCYLVRNVITPNNDGTNDVFTVTCINDFPASLLVFDRWGKLVYEQSEYDGSWDGTSLSGEALIEGGYMYVIDINFGSGNREIMRGTVTILRD